MSYDRGGVTERAVFDDDGRISWVVIPPDDNEETPFEEPPETHTIIHNHAHRDEVAWREGSLWRWRTAKWPEAVGGSWTRAWFMTCGCDRFEYEVKKRPDARIVESEPHVGYPWQPSSDPHLKSSFEVRQGPPVGGEKAMLRRAKEFKLSQKG